MNSSPYAENILVYLRRIIRALDRHSRELVGRCKLTVPQLVCLRRLSEAGTCSSSQLAPRVFLSQATLTGILDRLEGQGLITRTREKTDRRRILISLTDKGREMALSFPLPLQDKFNRRLAALPEYRQEQINDVLYEVVDMMERSADDSENQPEESQQPLDG